MSRRIAIYLTDTWRDARVAGFDNYAQKFERLLGPHMPDTVFQHFDVVEGDFPVDPTAFDGVVITGSSANVTENPAWLNELLDHIRQIDAAKVKLFAVCFGHQAVAVALGGRVEFRDVVLGSPAMQVLERQDWMQPFLDGPRIFAGNFQQVVDLPPSLTLIGTSAQCRNVMAVKGRHILSLQFHPELSAKYMHNYFNHAGEDVPDDILTLAKQEVDQGSDGNVIGMWAAKFLLGR